MESRQSVDEFLNYFFLNTIYGLDEVTIKFHYLSLKDELFIKAYNNSIRRMLTFGGKRKTIRKSRRKRFR